MERVGGEKVGGGSYKIPASHFFAGHKLIYEGSVQSLQRIQLCRCLWCCNMEGCCRFIELSFSFLVEVVVCFFW